MKGERGLINEDCLISSNRKYQIRFKGNLIIKFEATEKLIDGHQNSSL